MVLSYAITVCNELTEIQNLVTFLLDNKRTEDEIIITYDSKNGSSRVEEYLRSHSVNNQFMWYPFEFNGNFSDLKNHTKSKCSGDYICHLDADELLHTTLMEQLPQIIEINDVDLIWLPRVNTVDGITEQHIQQWGWRVTEKGWINYPDYQARVFRNGNDIKWIKPVHEIISGVKTFSHLPPYEELSLIHHKTIEKQEKQNKLYSELI